MCTTEFIPVSNCTECGRNMDVETVARPCQKGLARASKEDEAASIFPATCELVSGEAASKELTAKAAVCEWAINYDFVLSERAERYCIGCKHDIQSRSSTQPSTPTDTEDAGASKPLRSYFYAASTDFTR